MSNDAAILVTMIRPDAAMLAQGYRITSDQFELDWAGVIGPTALLLARRLVRLPAFGRGEVVVCDPLEMAARLGVTPVRVCRASDRLVRFGIGRWFDPATRRQLLLSPMVTRPTPRALGRVAARAVPVPA